MAPEGGFRRFVSMSRNLSGVYKAWFIAFAFAIAMAVPIHVSAHGGGLDAQGCHHNRKTGDYHCHRAQSPKQSLTIQPLDSPSRPAANGCNGKVYCKEMSSCSEAMYYLTKCSLQRLDGDGDGIPCETLCGSR